MKKKRTFAFRSSLAPDSFWTRLQEEAKQAHLAVEQSEDAFRLCIDMHHGGQVFYQARITADERGGSLIEGNMVTIPWNEGEEKTKLQKVAEVIGYILFGIVFSPLIVLLFLVGGLINLFSLIKNKGKRELPREEEKLLDMMLNKLSCTQITE